MTDTPTDEEPEPVEEEVELPTAATPGVVDRVITEAAQKVADATGPVAMPAREVMSKTGSIIAVALLIMLNLAAIWLSALNLRDGDDRDARIRSVCETVAHHADGTPEEVADRLEKCRR